MKLVCFQTNSILTRSCITTNRQITECAASPSNCSMCAVSINGACNTDVLPSTRRKCLYCEGEQCANNATASTVRYCPLATDQCVSINQAGVVSRMCSSEMTAANTTFCTTYAVSCVYCDSSSCNTVTPEPNSVARLLGSSPLTLLVLVGGAAIRLYLTEGINKA